MKIRNIKLSLLDNQVNRLYSEISKKKMETRMSIDLKKRKFYIVSHVIKGNRTPKYLKTYLHYNKCID